MPDVAPPDPSPPASPAPAKRTKYDFWAYLIIGLLGIFVILPLGVGALILPPGVAFALIRRGLNEGRPSWTVLGVLTGLLWLAGLAFTGRRIFGKQKRPAAPPPV